MEERHLLDGVKTRADHLAGACGVAITAFDLAVRDFPPDCRVELCARCVHRKSGRCAPSKTHLYGCFEAERWGDLYIYYCPLGLVFIATTVRLDGQPAYAMIGGPIVMGPAADILSDNGGLMAEEILSLPSIPPAQVTHIAQTQWALSMFLSGGSADRLEYSAQTKAELLNDLYEVSDQLKSQAEYSYPIDIERRLQQMILRGDKQGAGELINQLLGRVYFQTGGDLESIKARAAELVILFSHAAIEGGADTRDIFGLNRDMVERIRSFQDLDQLSAALTSIFHRFVGYVFDFGHIKHADVVHKAVDYVRANYAGKITLEDVADRVYISKSYLGKIFKEEMGCSFTSFVNSVRVEKSKVLLLERSIPLAQIAGMTGFDDQSYFTKVFRREVGVSPGQYRASGGKGAPA